MNQYDEDSDSSTSYRLPGLTHPEPFDYMAEGDGEREPPPPPETVDHSGLDSDPDSSDLGEGGEEEPPSREDPLDGWTDYTRWPGEEPKEVPRLPGLAPPKKASEARNETPAAGKAQAPDRPPEARSGSVTAGEEPGARGAGRSGEEEQPSEERGAGEKPGRAGGKGGYPENGKATQGRKGDAPEGRTTGPGPGTRATGAEEERRAPCERQALGGGNNPPREARNPAAQARDGDSGDVGFVSMEPETAPEEGAGEDGSKPEPQGYLQLGGVGTTKQSNTIGKWTRGCPLPEDSRGLLAHLWEMFKFRGAAWTPIYCRTMEVQLPSSPHGTEEVWRELEERGVIEVKEEYSYKAKRCREFRLATWAATELAEAGRVGKPRQKKTATGERHWGSRPVHSMRVMQENNHAWDWDVLTDALEVLKEARHVVNYDAGEEALEKLEEAKEKARERYEAQPSEETEKAAERAESRYASALACLQTIEDQTVEELDGGLRVIQNAYAVQTVSGRVSFIGGGPQGAPRAMKAALYDLPGVYNYDIRGSQTNGLRNLAAELAVVGVEVDTEPLEEYLERGGKDWVAETYGYARKLVGRAEHSVKFGAFIPESLKQARGIAYDRKKKTGRWELPDVVEHIQEFHSTDAEIDEAIATFREVFKDQIEMIREMAEALVPTDDPDEPHGPYWEANRKKGGKGQGWYMRNACKITFNPFEYEEGHKRRSKAMAWFLQGLEAAFVHAITALSTEYGYEVLANEHDGLITRGKVPHEATERARELSGFRAAEFIIKPLADQDELAELNVCLKHRNNTTTNDAPSRSGASATAGESTSKASTPKEPPSGARNVRPSLPPNRRRGASTTPSTSPTSPTPDTSTRRPGATTTSGTSTRTRGTEPS